ncbi:hypothetical protein DKG34_28675 [Streptomyces sp. NWU49]|uniref:hypothetical protein n=1 Tax=Streptomyces sp. NWU49 TaxID=2201153 RepID=UPI000D672AA8|nr:hypothetical protein [Streptomyces sp. NWU49]PWJ04191.1 hypothetical protein DKG34_28675 [Streptomyces sp. NWU49]
MSNDTSRTGTDGVDRDARAAAFDDEPDHGLRDPSVRAARDGRLRTWPPRRAGDVLAPLAGRVRVERLSREAALWGREVDDERYAVVAVPD